VLLTTFLALILVARPAYASYRWQVGYTAKGQMATAVAAGAAPGRVHEANCAAVADARSLGNSSFSTYMIQGDCDAIDGAWESAAIYYKQAITETASDSGERALALYNLWNTVKRYDQDESAAILTELNNLCVNSPRARSTCKQIINQVSK
ncbi:MAG: hypothetical protein HGA19_15920, partial [Oscillochloris sp.]|nr:hypothetical protein [Oscillochloris sp.]